MTYNILLVALGGSLGAVVRFYISTLLSSYAFPYSTLCVNLLGSFLLGALFGSSLSSSPSLMLFGATGFLGAFTTFSTFNLDIFKLLSEGRILGSIYYCFSGLLLGFGFMLAGYYLGSK